MVRFERLLQRTGPALLRWPEGGESRFLAVLGGGSGMVSVLGPDLAIHRLRHAVVHAVLCRDLEAPLAAQVDELLVEAGVSARRQGRARAAILGEWLSSTPIDCGWLLRLPPSASFWYQARQASLPSRLLAFVGGHAMQYLLWLARLVDGRSGRASGSTRPRLAARLGAPARDPDPVSPARHLVAGATRHRRWGAPQAAPPRRGPAARPEEMRHQGAGQLLGRVLEAEAVEALALSGGLLGLMAGMELLIAAAVLHAGAGGGRHALLLLAWVAVALLLGWRYWRQRRHWTEGRRR